MPNLLRERTDNMTRMNITEFSQAKTMVDNRCDGRGGSTYEYKSLDIKGQRNEKRPTFEIKLPVTKIKCTVDDDRFHGYKGPDIVPPQPPHTLVAVDQAIDSERTSKDVRAKDPYCKKQSGSVSSRSSETRVTVLRIGVQNGRPSTMAFRPRSIDLLPLSFVGTLTAHCPQSGVEQSLTGIRHHGGRWEARSTDVLSPAFTPTALLSLILTHQILDRRHLGWLMRTQL
jgi:hypothetical protein